MTTETDIKKFFQENKIEIPRDDRFMEEIVRQINLLPEPADLTRTKDEEEDKRRAILMIYKALKRYNKKNAIESTIISIIVCGAILSSALLIGEINSDSAIMNILISWRYQICSVICTIFVLSHCRRVSKELLR